MSRVSKSLLVLVAALGASIAHPIAAQAPTAAPSGRWPEARAAEWYSAQPWLVGANYAPANAINQLEMWQADTFDTARIDRELGWAEGIGMNTMRVFLHDLVWQQDAAGYKNRIDQFLAIADKHHIKPMLVLFDSVWDPLPKLGKQREPTPGVHNSGWVQGPGAAALQDASQHARLEAYVTGVVGAFANDRRVLAWDVWNEPDNTNGNSYKAKEPANKEQLVLALLPKVFAWARAAKPSQPLTSGVWRGDWSTDEKMSPTDRVQIANSDVISFHNYDAAPELEKRIGWLRRYNRPLLCTEYMARGNGSTFAVALPVLKKHGIAAYNWGLVAGKTQTNLPWDSWRKPYTDREPEVWFHEVFRGDGTPYRTEETDLLKKLTAAPAAAQAPSSVMEDLLKDVKEARGKIVGLAKAMPDAAWDWRPAPGVRSTKEVFVHLTGDNYFIPVGAGSTAPAETGIGEDYKTVETFEKRTRTREQVLAELDTSFAFLEQQMTATTDAKLATPSKWPKMSTRQLWIASTTHLHEHLGQLIAYARSNKITPPWSK